MPRPGPRPYECVRRAWHSDRHHPIRGSLIQEIFRIANEVHSCGTRKNIEWQEKLPIVVLKAEEIMYSKANSEAEYSDLKTLWNRVNDAIDTIIRRDESSETGQFLQPCIEAALHLGCTPRRSSRSQRNESPTSYLRQTAADQLPSSLPSSCTKFLNISSKANYGNHTSSTATNNTSLMLHYPQYYLTDHNNNSITPSSSSCQIKSPNGNKFPILPKEFGPDYSNLNHHASNTWSVYPLYYFNRIRDDDPKLFDWMKPSSNQSFSPHIIVMENKDNNIGLQQNLFQCSSSNKVDASDFLFPSKQQSSSTLVDDGGPDLTLRLGQCWEY